MSAFYNEIEAFPAAWLENLAAAGHIAPGLVETTDIRELDGVPEGTNQAHFFAGIGVWSYALRLAGWPDDAPVWTGSCPCQPFSSAGSGKGFDDARHLWPEWFRLIEKHRPPIIFGEQVASPPGRSWLDVVSADLEALDYAVGAADLCAAGIGAPHIRQRLFFVAYARDQRRDRLPVRLRERGPRQGVSQAPGSGSGSGMAYADGPGPQVRKGQRCDARPGEPTPQRSDASLRMGDAESQQQGEVPGVPGEAVPEPSGGGPALRMGDADLDGAGRDGLRLHREEAPGGLEGVEAWRLIDGPLPPGATGGPWGGADWILCRPAVPGKPPVLRPVEPGSFPLANGPTSRVGRLRAYGNAIVPQVAAAFISSALEAIEATETRGGDHG